MTPSTSLLDRANLDRDSVRNEIARGLQGADDGELFLEYSQTEALMFDNGRLKQATYDTSQGFGLRAVKDDAVGYAHSSDVSLPALIRAADAVHAVRGGYSGTFAAAPAHTNVRLYGDDNPLDAPGFESKVKLLAEIDAYVAGGDWAGKAGGYGFQGAAGVFVMNLHGSYSGVVGLPLYETWCLLAGLGCLAP